MKYLDSRQLKQPHTNHSNAIPVSDDFTLDYDFVVAHDNLMASYEGLTLAQRSVDEVIAIMDNIETSINLLKKYDKMAIPMLNSDAGLEDLMAIPERLITVDKAIEALEGEKKGVFAKFIDGVKAFFKWIWDFLKSVFDKITSFFSKTKVVEEKIKNTPKETLEKNIKEETPEPVKFKPTLLLTYTPDSGESSDSAPSPDQEAAKIDFDYDVVMTLANDISALIFKVNIIASDIRTSNFYGDDTAANKKPLDHLRSKLEQGRSESHYVYGEIDGHMRFNIRTTKLLQDKISAGIHDDKSFEEHGWSAVNVTNFIVQVEHIEESLKELPSHVSGDLKKYAEHYEKIVHDMTKDPTTSEDWYNKLKEEYRVRGVELRIIIDAVRRTSNFASAYIYEVVRQLIKLGKVDKDRFAGKL